MLCFETFAFAVSEITPIHIPSSVEAIGVACFYGIPHLMSLTFQRGSKLSDMGATKSELLRGVRFLYRSFSER
jgi:hypothetical protein